MSSFPSSFMFHPDLNTSLAYFEGDKSLEELYSITENIVDILIKKNVKLIVIACNTATTSCMKKLREKYPNTIFVGTVPAIKVAYDNHYKEVINLLRNSQ